MNGLNEYNDNDIVNRALLKLGQETVIDLTEDNERARAANALYNSVRDTLLSTYRWNFATKRAILEACELTPAFGFKYQYDLPSDFLRLISLPDAPDNARDNYAIEQQHILTDYKSPLKIIYTARVTRANLFPPYFIEAFACLLAYELCDRLKQDVSRKNVLMQEYEMTIREAKKSNAIQLANISLPTSDYINVRKGY